MSDITEYEYRIEYIIQRSVVGDDDIADDWEEIGFGSSAAWMDIDGATHALSSDLQNGSWETEGGHPDPDEVIADIQAAKERRYE